MRQVFVEGVRVTIVATVFFALGAWIIYRYKKFKAIDEAAPGDCRDESPVFGWILWAAGLIVVVSSLDIFLNLQWLAVKIIIQQVI
jgi:hypothetical protein